MARNTDLKGGVIASTEAAVQEGRNSYVTGGTLTAGDMQNRAEYEAKSTSIGIGAGKAGQTLGVSGVGAGIGSDKGADSSTTASGISGVAGNTSVRSTDAATGIERIFDKDKARKEIDAQVAITEMFGREASKAVGDYAASQARDLEKRLQAEADPGERAVLQGEIAKWGEGGAYRILLHTLTGASGGGLSGATGAAVSAGSANLLDDMQDSIEKSMRNAGLDQDAARTIAQGVAMLTAAGIGASFGGTQGAASAATVDANNRQLHPTEARLIKENASRFAQQIYGIPIPTEDQIKAAETLLANTAQVLLDNNLGYVVPYSKEADDFLQQLKIEYVQQNGSLALPDTQGQEQVFYASVDQKNQPWMNRGSADPTITSVIIKTPLSAAINNPANDSSRDRLTGLPLDQQHRYMLATSVDGKSFSPRCFSCATTACVAGGKNLDMSDPGTQAYVKALDAQVFKDISKGTNYGTLVVATGPAALLFSGTGIAAAIGSALTDSTALDEVSKFVSQQGATAFFVQVLGHTPAAAARAVAIVDLAGGWEAFVKRMKIDVMGIENEKK